MMCTSVQDENYEHSLYISDIRSNYEKRGVDSLYVPRARVVGMMLLCLGSLMHRVMLCVCGLPVRAVWTEELR